MLIHSFFTLFIQCSHKTFTNLRIELFLILLGIGELLITILFILQKLCRRSIHPKIYFNENPYKAHLLETCFDK